MTTAERRARVTPFENKPEIESDLVQLTHRTTEKYSYIGF